MEEFTFASFAANSMINTAVNMGAVGNLLFAGGAFVLGTSAALGGAGFVLTGGSPDAFMCGTAMGLGMYGTAFTSLPTYLSAKKRDFDVRQYLDGNTDGIRRVENACKEYKEKEHYIPYSKRLSAILNGSRKEIRKEYTPEKINKSCQRFFDRKLKRELDFHEEFKREEEYLNSPYNHFT